VPSYEDELAQIVAQLNRAAPTSRALRPETGQSTATLDQLLGYATRRTASDVLLIVGAPVILRVNGALTPVTGPVLSAEDTRNLLLPLLAASQYEELQRNKSVDLCFTREGIGRFRGNIHHQRGTLAGSIRLLQDLPEVEDLLEARHDAPIIRMLNALLSQAVNEGASDVHVEPFENTSVVRYRVDGVLRDIVRPRRALHAALVSRIKIMASLDIAEKRLPQDGRIMLRLGGLPIDVRVSMLHT